MAEAKQDETKDYAGGWITEREGTDVPTFLKFCYPVIAIGCIIYLVIYMNGEVSHADRGDLVQKLNAVTGGADTFMWIVLVLAVVFTIVTVIFGFKKAQH
jgi:hypothetical protein